MRAKITAQGVLIPKDWFADATEVEIRKEEGRIIVVALNDPIFSLGTRPVKTGVTDASENLDKHLYS
jgi:virulence-associated protein VagC